MARRDGAHLRVRLPDQHLLSGATPRPPCALSRKSSLPGILASLGCGGILTCPFGQVAANCSCAAIAVRLLYALRRPLSHSLDRRLTVIVWGISFSAPLVFVMSSPALEE